MFVLTVIFGTAAGLALGGRLRNLVDLPIRFAWIPLAGFGLQFLLVMFPPDGWEQFLGSAPVVIGISYLTLLAFLWLNRRIAGVKLLMLGAALNFAVILANGGHMPVTVESLERSGHLDRVIRQGDLYLVKGSKDVVLERSETRLWPLSDIFGIPEELPFSASFSAGDVVIIAGAFMLLAQGIRGGLHSGRGTAKGWGKGGFTGMSEEGSHVF